MSDCLNIARGKKTNTLLRKIVFSALVILCWSTPKPVWPEALSQENGIKRPSGNDLEIVVQGDRVTMDIKDRDLHTVLEALADRAGIKIETGPGMRRKISLKAVNEPLEAVLKKLCENQAVVFEYDSEKKTYRIVSVGAYISENSDEKKNSDRPETMRSASSFLSSASDSPVKKERISKQYIKKNEPDRDHKGRPRYKQGEILIRFKKGVSKEHILNLHHAMGSRVLDRNRRFRIEKIGLKQGLSEKKAIEQYMASGLVETAEKHVLRYVNRIVPNDTHFDLQYGMNKIQAPEAWEIVQGKSTVVIAVIDTGVDYNHPDLKDNIWQNTDEFEGDQNGDGFPGVMDVDDDGDAALTAESDPNDLTDNDGDGLIDENGIDFRDENVMVADYDKDGIRLVGPDGIYGTADDDTDDLQLAAQDDDENGFVDDLKGWDFAGTEKTSAEQSAQDDEDANPMDVAGHGTHVAGILASKGNNGLGVAGVAWNVKIMPLKVQADNHSEIEVWDVIEALGYALFNGARILNCSFGGSEWNSFEKEAFQMVRDAGILAVCAAGNSGVDSDEPGNEIYPASYELDNIISVTASDQNDDLPGSFANYGLLSVDLMAPGKSIYSTYLNNTYETISGTSMAVPHVTGIAGLLLSFDPELHYTQLKATILETVDKIPALSDRLVSGGRANALKALQSLFKQGDVSANNQLGLEDAILALQVVSKSNPDIRAEWFTSKVDVNGDARIGLAEAMYVIQALAGL